MGRTEKSKRKLKVTVCIALCVALLTPMCALAAPGDTAAPEITNAKQNTADWAMEKTFSAHVEDASGVAQVFYSKYPDRAATGTTMAESPAGSGTYVSGTLTEAGVWYVYARDAEGNLSNPGVRVDVTSVGLADEPSDNEYIPQYPGESGHSTMITVEMTDKKPLNLSVTVPLQLPIAMKLTGGADDAPELYWPGDGQYYIMNTSLNYTDETRTEKYPVTVRVKEVRLRHAEGIHSVWSLVPETDVAAPSETNAFQMALNIGGTQMPALAAGDRETKTVTPAGALAQDIPQDHKLTLSIQAAAGGVRKSYQGQNGTQAELFKVGYILELAEETP